MGLFSNMVKSLQAASIDDVIYKIEEETTIPASLVTPSGDEKNDKRVQNFICELLKKEYGAENVNTDCSLGRGSWTKKRNRHVQRQNSYHSSACIQTDISSEN